VAAARAGSEQHEQLLAAQSHSRQLLGEEGQGGIQGLSLEQLHARMQAVEGGATRLRRAVLAAEVSAQSQAEAAEAAACAVCFTRRCEPAAPPSISWRGEY
jgi:DNA-directed RNA polymerase specialized sigma24 family protein